MKSAEWIIIINKHKELLNVDNETKTSTTEMADMADVLSPEEIEKRNNDNNNKQQETTIELSDNDEQQTTIEISDNDVTEKGLAEQVHDISSLTGFTHGKKHKEGVTRSKRVPTKGKN